MNINMNPRWLHRSIFLVLVIVLTLPFLGESAHAAPLQASTVSITLNNPTCVQPNPNSGLCSIEIESLVASGSDPSFSRIEVMVNGKLRAFMGGFFEASAYLNNTMIPGGLKVPCGRPNDGGSPNYGKIYQLVANAYMADGTSASDSMNVYCPAFEATVFLPSLRK